MTKWLLFNNNKAVRGERKEKMNGILAVLGILVALDISLIKSFDQNEPLHWLGVIVLTFMALCFSVSLVPVIIRKNR